MKESRKERFEKIKKDMLMWIGSWAIVWLIFLLWDSFSDIAKEYWIREWRVFVVKAVVSCLWIILVMNRIEKKKLK